MCIYCGTTKYKKIFIHHHGRLPIEPSGRVYEVHHVDGNHKNNHPLNLKAVTLQEHYDIHYQQGDFRACTLIGLRLNLTTTAISDLARKNANKNIKNGTHNFLGKLNPVYKQLKNGTHSSQNEKLTEELRHRNSEMFKNGTHPTQTQWTCLHCNKSGKGQSNYKRWHGINCKFIYT
jgi:hypothetical protein